MAFKFRLNTASAEPPFKKAGRYFYKASYITGEKAVILFGKITKKTRRAVSFIALKAAGSFQLISRKFTEYKKSRAVRGDISFTRSVINFSDSFCKVLKSCRCEFAGGGFFTGFSGSANILKDKICECFSRKKNVFNYVVPAVSVFILVVTVYFWSGSCFALSVSYGGKNLGIVSHEQDFKNAAEKVEQNVTDASGKNFSLNNKITMKLVLAKKTDLLSEDQMYNNIVAKSCEGVKSGYGLYVDNRLAGASSTNETIEAMLNGMTEKYRKEPNVQSVEFSQDVSVKSGLFPSSVFKSQKEMKKIVTGKEDSVSSGSVVPANISADFRISLDPLYAMNLSGDAQALNEDTLVSGSSCPKLTVKVLKTEEYDAEIPYETEQSSSDKLKSGRTVIKTYGHNGSQHIVASVSYVDGVKTDENIVSSTVIDQPVTQKVVVGTKKSSGNSGSSSSSVSGRSGGLAGYAQSAIGVPYVSGGSSRSGFDCSGFTSYVFSKYGVHLPHSAAAQSAYGSYVSRSNLEQGDLVFFDTNGGHNSISHVGIYLGGGRFIDASSSRPHAVTIDSLNSRYYSSRFMTARRVLK